MKFKVRNITNGAIKIVEKFLWFPTTALNLKTNQFEKRWLETAKLRYTGFVDFDGCFWILEGFVD